MSKPNQAAAVTELLEAAKGLVDLVEQDETVYYGGESRALMRAQAAIAAFATNTPIDGEAP